MDAATLDRLCREIADWEPHEVSGRLRSATGLLLTCSLPAAIGDYCEVLSDGGGSTPAEVIGFNDGLAHLVSYRAATDLRAGQTVVRRNRGLSIPVGNDLLGRILDGIGRPIDSLGPLQDCQNRTLGAGTPGPLERARISEPFVTGQRVIDGLMTCGWGQRVGIFAGSGVGKSTLLGQIAKGSNADLNVIALIGERGREVRSFIEDCLGTVVVVATSDQTPLMRVRAAQAAITMADHFRQQGKHVLFLLDSLTRLAMAQRELGLALGEPPSARGYTPSVFQLLASTIEHLGNGATGSITGILTVLVDGGDLNEPISDAVRALVDGHIVLDRRLAEKGHYPAVNVGQSLSRVMHDVTDTAFQVAARKLRAILAISAETEDLVRIGAYARGSNPQIDRAIDLKPAVDFFLKQDMGKQSTLAECRAALEKIAAAWPF